MNIANVKRALEIGLENTEVCAASAIWRDGSPPPKPGADRGFREEAAFIRQALAELNSTAGVTEAPAPRAPASDCPNCNDWHDPRPGMHCPQCKRDLTHGVTAVEKGRKE